MFQDHPFCAQLWYETRLNVPAPAARADETPRTEATCRVERSPAKTFLALEADAMYRAPSVTSTRFGDVSPFWYMN